MRLGRSLGRDVKVCPCRTIVPLYREHVDEYIDRAYDGSRPLRPDAPELVGTAEPGLFTLLREWRTGRKLAIDYSNYYEQLDPYLRELNRRNGIYFRDPCYWP